MTRNETATTLRPVCGQCSHYYNPNSRIQGYCPMGFSRDAWGEEQEGKTVSASKDASRCYWFTESTPF